MGKTRRKLYGKSRRRRQRGGGGRWWVLLGALAVLKGAHAEEPGFRQLVTDWWTSKTVAESAKNSIALGKYMSDMKWASGLSTTFASTVPETEFAPPPEEEKEKEDDVVEPYLESVRMGVIDTPPEGMGFLQGEVKIIGEEKEEDEPELWIIEKTIDGRPEQYAIEKQFVKMKGGRKRRKTLRRRK
jgi:hypothetical protein